jgi:hypothetical protein
VVWQIFTNVSKELSVCIFRKKEVSALDIGEGGPFKSFVTKSGYMTLPSRGE